MAGPKIIVDGDTTKMQRALEQGVRALDKIQERMQQAARRTQEQVESNRKEREARRQAQQELDKHTRAFEKHMKAVKAAQTPHERYKESIKELQAAEKAGIGTAEQHAAARDQVKAALFAEERALEENTEEHRKSVAVQKMAKQAMENQIPPLLRYRREMRSLIRERRAERISVDEYRAARRQLRTELEKGMKGEQSALQGMVKGFAAAAASALSIQQALALAAQAMQEIKEFEEARADASMTVAQAEVETRRNLATLPPAVQEEQIKFAKELAAREGTDVAQTVLAFGRTFSASGGNLQAAKDATALGAKFGVLNPENIGTYATGFADIMQTFGGTAEQAASLIQTFQGRARLEDPKRAGRILAAPATQAAEQYADDTLAARQSAALLALFTTRTADKFGEASQTALLTLQQKVATTFDDVPAAIEEAQTKVTKLEREEAKSLARETEAERRSVAIEEQEKEVARLRGARPGTERALEFREATATLADMKADLQVFTDTTKQQAADRTKELDEQRKLIAALQQVEGQDPGELFGRLEMFQRFPALMALIRETEFGEQKFKTVITQTLQGKNEQALENILQDITTDPEVIRGVLAREEQSPVIAAARRRARSENRITGAQVQPRAADITLMRETVERTLNETAFRGNWFGGVSNAQARREAMANMNRNNMRNDVAQRGAVALVRRGEQMMDRQGVMDAEQVTAFAAGSDAIQSVLLDILENDKQIGERQRQALEDLNQRLQTQEETLAGMAAAGAANGGGGGQ